MNMEFPTINELSVALERGELTSVSLTRLTLERIGTLDQKLNAFVRITEARALREAKASDDRRSSGKTLGKLDGIPYAVKDIFDVADVPTLCGLSSMESNVASDDSTVVNRLSNAGMVLIGKTHTHQLACYITGINPDLGTPHNPWSAEHLIPGGSSSGSAVAVAAGMLPVAIGSDTAGSIRVPAALCGIVGHKPTAGLIGRGGVHPLSWSLDTVGTVTGTVADTALVLDALIGPDERDETTQGRGKSNLLGELCAGVSGIRIAVCNTVYLDGCHTEAIQAMNRVADLLSNLGAVVNHVDIPEIAEAREEPDRDVILFSEAYSVNREILESPPDNFDPVASYMLEGKQHSASDYYNALRRCEDLRRRFSMRFRDIDAFIAPTTVDAAWSVSRVSAGEMPGPGYTRNTDAANTLNLASISIPAGTNEAGLPLGVSINAPAFSDALVLRIANAIQTHAPELSSNPDLSWI